MSKRVREEVGEHLGDPLAVRLADGVLAADDENWGVIRSETSRLNRLVDDLQKVSRAQAHQLDLHLAPAAAAVLVSDAVKAAQPVYTSKGVGLEAHIEPRVSAIERFDVALDGREWRAELVRDIGKELAADLPSSTTPVVTTLQLFSCALV